MSIRDEIREQNKKSFREMNFKDKVKHFWHYYKIHVGVIAIIIAFITYLILHNTLFKPLPYGFAGYALSSNYYAAVDLSKIESFINDFAATAEISTDDYQVVFDVSNAVNPDSVDMLDMAVDMKIVNAGEHGEVDVLIGSSEQIDFYIINNFYHKTLDQILPEDLFHQLDEQNLIYYYYDEESDAEYAIGIYIKDAPRIRELELYNEDVEPILAICALSDRTNTSVEFVRYIFETP